MVAKKNEKSAEQQANEDAHNSDQFTVGGVDGPNPFWQTGNVVTTEGGQGARIEDVAPIFAQARLDALENAAEDPESEAVVLPEDNDDKTNKEAVADLKDAVKEAKEDVKTNDKVVLKDGEKK